MTRRGLDPDQVSAEFREFWAQRRTGILVTPRRDGTPHVVAVGVTLDVEAGLARVICSRGSQKARNVAAGGPAGVRAVVSQVDGRRWSSLEGRAVVCEDRESVTEAERRYEARYRAPRVNPQRVVIEISIDRVLGMA
ncbi:pyridoxamine 5'-phosphate oxidase family protein [Pseudonocardia hispaniensis]|uniref:Pyridoxamine 5'-phosphate oxidase family protein n=1 Tax=Pseudonocardia hispaniensis TaxID=904933 RepID=A0ABW1J6C2_9PSEU